jgi:hypothetical protein
MKYIDGQYVPISEQTELFFNKNAQEIQSNVKEQSFSKIIVKNDRETYYIRVRHNTPCDPLGSREERTHNTETKMTLVSKKTFDFYMMYLKTNNSIYMTRARRGLSND